MKGGTGGVAGDGGKLFIKLPAGTDFSKLKFHIRTSSTEAVSSTVVMDQDVGSNAESGLNMLSWLRSGPDRDNY
jgi:hypothetical protein